MILLSIAILLFRMFVTYFSLISFFNDQPYNHKWNKLFDAYDLEQVVIEQVFGRKFFILHMHIVACFCQQRNIHLIVCVISWICLEIVWCLFFFLFILFLQRILIERWSFLSIKYRINVSTNCVNFWFLLYIRFGGLIIYRTFNLLCDG